MGCWLLVIGYLLLVVGYWLLVIGYWLLVIGYWLLVIGYIKSGSIGMIQQIYILGLCVLCVLIRLNHLTMQAETILLVVCYWLFVYLACGRD
ncbi:hypothetical protein [Microcoleus sp. CZ3-B2]|uniref:hypothetical protein n=1 Tax=unclassified Microcoleus TaxID=2642155 RepID=UPI003FA60E65